MKSEIFLLIIAGALLAAGTYFWQKGSHLIRYGKKTVARVLDNKKVSDKDSTHYFPIVEYITEDKQHLAHELNVGYQTPLHKGTEIIILYDPDEPTNVQLDSRAMLEVLPRCLVVAGLCGIVLVLFEVFEITSLMD